MANYPGNYRKPKKPPVFTDDMKRELKEMYEFFSLEELSKYFNVPVNKIRYQVGRQHLTKRDK